MADGPDPELMARFCREILPGMLADACGVAAPEADVVAEDVLSRAEAVACLDRESREILAAPFYEESFSHEPAEVPAWMKAITTIVVRNSRLEDLHVSGQVNAGGITAITTCSLAPLSHLIAARRRHPVPADGADGCFAGLATAYPRAWSCLGALRTALSGGGGRVGFGQIEAPIPDLPDAREVIDAPRAEHIEAPSAAFAGVVFSGIDPRFDQTVMQILEAAAGGELSIGLSGLSRISRNSRKLLRVIEFLLAHRARIITTNYLLTCDEVWVRRKDLVRPHSVRPMGGIGDLSGLSAAHRKAVETYVEQASQVGG